VRTLTLGSLVDDRPVAVLKIDAQGNEAAILAGGAEAVARSRVVLMEVTVRSHYEGDEGFVDLHRRMHDLGHDLVALSRPNLSVDGEALWADAAFVRRAG
jgi:hypothetical protein